MSALVLSEAIFIPLMVAGLWAIARLWGGEGEAEPRHPVALASFGGVMMAGGGAGAAVVVVVHPGGSGILGDRRWKRASGDAGQWAAVVILAMAAIMAPWWVRVYRIHGRFVPTALWVGASLYDGVGPQANGESDMRFVEEPDVRSLPELEQEDEFRARSIRAIRADRCGSSG